MRNTNTQSRNCGGDLEPVWCQILAGLPEVEAEMIRLRVGLGGKKPLTVNEVAKALGVRREHVRRVEARARSKLRTISKKANRIHRNST